MENETMVIWEAPKFTPPEFRLYYDSDGKVITYTCEKLDGEYVVIDALTFAEARPDVRVIKGKVVRVHNVVVVAKLIPDNEEGQLCATEDISIIPNDRFPGEKQKWKLNINEY